MNWVACIVIAGFAAGIERRLKPALAKQPLVLMDYGTKRGKVIVCSPDAAALGVDPGLSLSRARGLCPNGAFIAADAGRYERTLDRLLNVLWTFSNRVEVEAASFPQSAICYIDLGSLKGADLERLAGEILAAVTQEIKLRCSVGIASGKLAARLAALYKGVSIIPHGGEREFIAPFPVDHLTFDPESRRRLDLLGIHTIGQYADLPASSILGQFGKAGRHAHQLACGWDRRPVTPRKMPPIEGAARVFEEPLTSLLRLDIVINDLAGELEQRLEARVSALHEIVVTLTFADVTTQTERLHLLEPVATAMGIARVIRQLLERREEKGGLIRIDVQLTHLVPAMPRQLELFTHKPARQALIDLTVVLTERYWGAAFYQAEIDTPDALILDKCAAFRKLDVS